MPTDGTAPIRLVLNGERVDVAGVSPQTTLRMWIASVVDEAKINSIFHRIRPALVSDASPPPPRGSP